MHTIFHPLLEKQSAVSKSNWNRHQAGFHLPAWRICKGLILIALFALAAGCHFPSGHTFVVNSVMDLVNGHDENPGDGICKTTGHAYCTLRAAIEEANALPGADKIYFNIPAAASIHLSDGGFPGITEDLTIDGRTQPQFVNEPIIYLNMHGCQAGPCDLFSIDSGVSLAVWGLRIITAERYAFNNQGELWLENMRINAPVYSRGFSGLAKLTVISSRISNLHSHPAIETVNSTVSVSSSTIFDATSQDPAVEAGGMVIRGGTATITETEIKHSTGWKSGGMYIDGAEVHLYQTAVTGNTGWDAGGIYVESDSELWVDRSWIGAGNEGNTSAVISDGDKFGGGIYSEGKIHVSDSIVEGNSGAGIHSRGVGGNTTLEITDSQIMNNSLAGIYATQTDMEITDSQIQYNENGGISLAQGSLTVTGSSLSGNQNDGGIHVEAASLLVIKSTVSGNTASDKGGGLSLYATLGIVEIANSTISGNQAVHDGGGIAVTGGIVELKNVTVTLNSAGHGAGLYNATGAIHVSNTIVADNSGGNCDGTITSGGHNLDTRSTCGFSGPGDISNMNAMLGPLQYNGGSTKTHALPNSSPALEAGDDGTCLATDQRGVIRPQGLHCDMGSYEAEMPATATSPSITSTLTPTLTPTSTPTPAAAKIIFDPVNFSSDLIYNRYARSCTPKEVTIQIKVSPAEWVKSVGFFYKLEEKGSTNVTPWNGGLAMIPQGGGWYTITLLSEDFPADVLQWNNDAWLAVQFVANGQDGQILTRSAVYRKVTLGRCMK
jgi:CSLREA domain-containing protein